MLKKTTVGKIVVATPASARSIYYRVERGELRRITSKIYSSDMLTPIPTLIRENIWKIAGVYLPGAILIDRTALENRISPSGNVYLGYRYRTSLQLNGVNLITRKCAGPVEGDLPFIGGLYHASLARAYLENLRPTKTAEGGEKRVFTRDEIENKLIQLSITLPEGDKQLRLLRTQADRIAPLLHLEAQALDFGKIIGAVLNTNSTPNPNSPSALLHRDIQCDEERKEIFDALSTALHSLPDSVRGNVNHRSASQKYLPFFEAYFSNYIEGTEFEISEAYGIVYAGNIPEQRPEDAHDVMGTFHVVSDLLGMEQPYGTFEGFCSLMRSRHANIMSGRPNLAGIFKTQNNTAGGTSFVHPSLVLGTLRYGYDRIQEFRCPVKRALMAMAVVSEVHPFVDGNGRIARVMMNAELIRGGQHRIIIPASYRTEYIQSLKALTHNQNPEPFIRVMLFAQKYVSQLNCENYRRTVEILEKTHAFSSPSDAMGGSQFLILPEKVFSHSQSSIFDVEKLNIDSPALWQPKAGGKK